MLDPRTHEPANPFLLYHGNGTAKHGSYNNSSSWEEEVDSPPLWSTSPSRDHNRNTNNHYRSMSPASRTQAIVRGQRELMEMVKNMPESNYELSLKDLVEHHHRLNNNNNSEKEAATAEEDKRKTKTLKKGSGGGGSSSRRVVRRSGSIDRGSGGFYLKMVIPSFSLGSKKKNKNKNKNNNESLASANNSKVSPRPTAINNNNNNSDKEWWKKGDDSGSSSVNSGSSTKRSGSSSSSNSTSSTSNNSRQRHDEKRNNNGDRCWPCIPRRKSHTQK
ncbi:hypothetical protein PIB30_057061 [Stylosanthes scabra]|uniref:Uncharacterized protein n=1 Tax=Stylosanthes scabra TaxID=79078 RepID=A0ABU6ZIA2_9FABA|nr:hypothetical protein [Stylosanthes scabra]